MVSGRSFVLLAAVSAALTRPTSGEKLLQLCGGACSDGMVLDRANATLWGLGEARAAELHVTVADAAGQITARAAARADGPGGEWRVQLPAQLPGVGYSVHVNSSSGAGVSLLDVAFGDVILCSGQSNMELPLAGVANGSALLAESDLLGRLIRVMRVDHYSSPNHTIESLNWEHDWAGRPGRCTDRCGAPWGRMSSQLGQFSAVCYTTGRALMLALQSRVPVGLVEAAWGGTRIEAWMSPAALASCPGTGTAGCGPCLAGDGEAAACARMNSSNSGNLCSCNYNGMLWPIRKMRFKAMLWYQGESNTVPLGSPGIDDWAGQDTFQGSLAGPTNYACRIHAAVQDWRLLFDSPELPFFNVELSACDNYPSRALNAQVWAYIRQASRSFLALAPPVGFITAIDLGLPGGGVHSTAKQPDGHRLALQILKHVYHVAVTATGPVLSAAPVLESDRVLALPFSGASALHAAPARAYNTTGSELGCHESPFELGLADGSWTRANFTISDSTVRLATAGVQATEVRYAWQGFPQCVLYSSAGDFESLTALPAPPFRVAIGPGCADTQGWCSLANTSVGYKTQAQCCFKATEACVENGGCQSSVWTGRW